MSDSQKITLATVWLDGCSGCHMSFLDLDQRLITLAEKVDVVYSPLVDAKELPQQVDVGLIEGAVSTQEDLHKAQQMRRACDFLISLGVDPSRIQTKSMGKEMPAVMGHEEAAWSQNRRAEFVIY